MLSESGERSLDKFVFLLPNGYLYSTLRQAIMIKFMTGTREYDDNEIFVPKRFGKLLGPKIGAFLAFIFVNFTHILLAVLNDAKNIQKYKDVV